MNVVFDWVQLARKLREGGRKMIDCERYYRSYSLFHGFQAIADYAIWYMNNILPGAEYRASPEGVSLIDETNNLASHRKLSLGTIPLDL